MDEYFGLPGHLSSEIIVEQLKQNGFFVIKPFIEEHLLATMSAELLDLFDKVDDDDDYVYGKVIASMSLKTWDLNKTPTVRALFKGPTWMEKIAKGYQKIDDGVNLDLISTFDYKSDAGEANNGWAHFDRRQKFKFMIYLSDVDENCGPFSVVPGTQNLGRELRLKDNSKHRFGRYFGDPGICENYSEPQNHFPDYEYEMKRLTGKMGTIIIFDSDLIHQGGQVGPNQKRLIVRGHSW